MMDFLHSHRPPFNLASKKPWRRTLRSEMPKAELLLWGHIRRDQMGVRFRRQFGVGPYSLDFYCPKLKLAIELDGDSHFEKGAVEHDKRRDEYLKNFGIKTIRFRNDEVYYDLFNVLKKIKTNIPPLARGG